MKLIITEQQLRLIIESEQEGRLMNVPSEMLTDKESYDRVFNLYKDNKEITGFKEIYINNLISKNKIQKKLKRLLPVEMELLEYSLLKS